MGGQPVKDPISLPDAAEYGQHRAFLASKGVSQSAIDVSLPLGGEATMTRTEVVEKMVDLFLTFPKAV